MQCILGERPREHPGEEGGHHRWRREVVPRDAADHKKRCDREPNDKRRSRMDTCELFEKVILEHAAGGAPCAVSLGWAGWRGFAGKLRVEDSVDHGSAFASDSGHARALSRITQQVVLTTLSKAPPRNRLHGEGFADDGLDA